MTWRNEPAHGVRLQVGQVSKTEDGLTIREELAARMLAGFVSRYEANHLAISEACKLADDLCTEFEWRGWRKGDE